ncbi:MAG: hypothetical protein LUE86_02165 [Clostridiales bacterium]|nr:hypothetical protein [Clostridiales bacterium]
MGFVIGWIVGILAVILMLTIVLVVCLCRAMSANRGMQKRSDEEQEAFCSREYAKRCR